MKADLSPTQDDKVTAALAHAAIILPMWGLIISTIIWITQREKSAYVRDQALQALAWQASQMGIMFVGMGCYMVSFFGLFASMAAVSPEANAPPPGFFLPFCVLGFVFLSMFIFIITGLFAAVRSLQSSPFTYPFVGNWIRSYMHNR